MSTTDFAHVTSKIRINKQAALSLPLQAYPIWRWIKHLPVLYLISISSFASLRFALSHGMRLNYYFYYYLHISGGQKRMQNGRYRGNCYWLCCTTYAMCADSAMPRQRKMCLPHVERSLLLICRFAELTSRLKCKRSKNSPLNVHISMYIVMFYPLRFLVV